MADMRGTGAAQTAATDEDRFKFERRVALLAGVVVVAFVLYLAQRNQAFADPNLAIMMRIVLSLSIGIVGATIPGFLHLEYNLGGFAVRAGGALALFVLTFFGTPEVSALNLKLPDPQVSLLAPRVVDFRTEAAPTQSEDERGTAATVVTIPTGIRSTVEPARKATLSASQISFSLDATNYEFAWRYFVNMHPEQFGLWLAIQEDAHTSPIEPGGSFFREILHEPTNTAPWADFVRRLLETSEQSLTVKQSLVLEGVPRDTFCRVNLEKWRAEVKRFMEVNKILPGRITMNCEA
jgi:hypothetical protein